jgi:RNA polymerase sigma factor (sigma-70 family)
MPAVLNPDALPLRSFFNRLLVPMASNTPDTLLIELIDRIGALQTQPGGATRAAAESALRQLYDLTSSKLYGVALRVVGNREWAEDVLQDAFLNIWRIAGDYRAALSPPMAWMGVIVRSRALDFLRRRNTERVDMNQPLDEFINDTVANDQPNPMDTTQASERAWALHQCLGRLENKHREVVSLAYLRDLSHGELAQQLRLPLGTVKTWIRRGLEQLRGCMARFS